MKRCDIPEALRIAACDAARAALSLGYRDVPRRLEYDPDMDAPGPDVDEAMRMLRETYLVERLSCGDFTVGLGEVVNRITIRTPTAATIYGSASEGPGAFWQCGMDLPEGGEWVRKQCVLAIPNEDGTLTLIPTPDPLDTVYTYPD